MALVGQALTHFTSMPTDPPGTAITMVVGTHCFAAAGLEVDAVIDISSGTGTAYLLGWYQTPSSSGKWASVTSLSLDSSIAGGNTVLRASPGNAPTYYTVLITGGPTVTAVHIYLTARRG